MAKPKREDLPSIEYAAATRGFMPTAWEQRPTVIFALFAGLLGFAVAAFAPQIFHDGDSWWHLAAGGWMLDHHAVLKRDMFSFTFAGQPWDAQEWLAEIVMALVFRVGGLSALSDLPASAAACWRGHIFWRCPCWRPGPWKC
jgi:hypothetical protein